MPIRDEEFEQGLKQTIETLELQGLGPVYHGKVRDNYVTEAGRLLVVTDRISAFDRVLGTIPFKGQLLNTLTSWWFRETANVAPNHFLAMPDPNAMLGVECTPLPAEFVVRAHLTGVTDTSIWSAYSRGDREYCGHRLPDGLKQYDALESPLLTPSTKADKGEHDISVSRSELLASGKISARDFDAAAELAQALFRRGQEMANEKGLILADTKYEFGRTPSGDIIVIDEIHTPDSSRYWYNASFAERRARGEAPESLDKEYVRVWLKSVGYAGDGPSPELPKEVRVEAARRYARACELLMGEDFEPNVEEPLQRLERNLAGFRVK